MAASTSTKEADKRAKAFVDYMNKTYKKLSADAAKIAKSGKGMATGKDLDYYKNFPTVTFAVNKGNTKLHSPQDKAEGLSAGRTQVCWSAHMVDKARHINTKVNGKTVNHTVKTALGVYHADYAKHWAAGLKTAKLRNWDNGLTWAEGDPPHVELPNSKIADFTDDLVKQCLTHYAKITRKDGKKKNTDFEKKYAKELAPYLKKYATKKGAKAAP